MIIDIVAGVLIAYGFYSGYKKGIISALFGIVSLIVGVVAALKISPIVINILKEVLTLQDSLVFIIGFVLTFFLVMLLVRFIGNRLESLFKAVNLNVINKLLGGALMSLVFALLLGYLIFGMEKLSLVDDAQKSSSITYPTLATLPAKSSAIATKLKPAFEGFWNTMMETMDTIKEEGEQLNKTSHEE